MTKPIESLRALAAKNAALLASAQRDAGAIADASHAEIDRLGARIAGTKPYEALLDDARGEAYVRAVHDRGALMRQVAPEKS